jgi:hypothetical protein
LTLLCRKCGPLRRNSEQNIEGSDKFVSAQSSQSRAFAVHVHFPRKLLEGLHIVRSETSVALAWTAFAVTTGSIPVARGCASAREEFAGAAAHEERECEGGEEPVQPALPGWSSTWGILQSERHGIV